MAKVQLTGLGKSKGVKPPKPADPGTYDVEVTKCEVRATKDDTGILIMSTFQPFDGPEQQDGRDASAVRIYDMIWVPNEDHHSYEEMHDRQIDTVAQFQIAAGVKKKSDSFDPADLEGRQLRVVVVHETRKDKGEEVLDDEGNPVVDARVKRYVALSEDEEE